MASLGCQSQNPTSLFPDNSLWGLNCHQSWRNDIPDTSDIGVEWVRVDYVWHINESEEGRFDYSICDPRTEIFGKRGQRIIGVFQCTQIPSFYKDKDEDYIIDRAAAYMKETAKRYRGNRIIWEIQNEPENSGMWKNPDTYSKLAKKTAKAIKEADPTSYIAVCSACYADRKFIEKCLKNGILNDGNVDIVTFHGYGYNNNSRMPEMSYGNDIEWIRETIKKYSANKYISVMDSECGYRIRNDISKPRSSWQSDTVNREQQAAYLCRHYIEALYYQIECAVYYKDFYGEDSFSLYPTDKKAGLSEQGRVYRNMAYLFHENPTKLVNDRYEYTLSGEHSEILKTRSFLSKKTNNKKNDRLFIFVWNPVESAGGKILDRREDRSDLGKDFKADIWRDVKDTDIVDIYPNITVKNIKNIKAVYEYNLSAYDPKMAVIKKDFIAKENSITVNDVHCSCMPALLIIDLK